MEYQKKVRGLYRSLERVARGISGKTIRVKETADPENLGFTSNIMKVPTIFLNSEHELILQHSEEERVPFLKGVFAHELMHQLITDQAYEQYQLRNHSEIEAEILHLICNVIEDPRIEYFAPQFMGGNLLKCLRYSIHQIYEESQEIGSTQNPFGQYINALIQFGDGGYIKGDFSYKEAKQCFQETISIVAKAIETPDFRNAFVLMRKVFEKSRPLWEKEAKEAQQISDLIKRIREEAQKSERSGGDSIGGNMPVSQESGSSLNQKRRITIKKISQEEAKEMGIAKEVENSKDQGLLPDGTTVYLVEGDEQDEASAGGKAAVPLPAGSDGKGEETKDSPYEISYEGDEEGGDDQKNSYGDQDASTEKNEKNTGEDDAQTSEKNQKSGYEDSNAKNKNMESQQDSVSKGDSTYRHSGEYEAFTEEEVDEEDCELTEEDLKTAAKEALDGWEEIAKDEKEEEEAEHIDLDLSVNGPGYGNIRVINKNMQLSESAVDRYENAYHRVLLTMGSDIRMLSNQLRRLFVQEAEEKLFKGSGTLHIDRLHSGRMTTRVFTRRKQPNGSDVAIAIGVDNSGSMGGAKIRTAINVSIALSEVFHVLQLPIYLLGYESGSADSVQSHFVKWKNTRRERMSILSMASGGCNFDAYTVRYLAERLKKRPETHKILFMISDGMPSHSCGTLDGVTDTRIAVKQAEKICDVIGIGIGQCDPGNLRKIYGTTFIHVQEVKDLFSRLGRCIRLKIKSWE